MAKFLSNPLHEHLKKLLVKQTSSTGLREVIVTPSKDSVEFTLQLDDRSLWYELKTG